MSADYSNAKIYKIVPNDLIDIKDVYIGSTTKQLEQRMLEHQINYQKIIKKTMFSSEYLFNKYGFENCKIELIELFPCNSIEALHKRKGEIIRKIECIT